MYKEISEFKNIISIRMVFLNSVFLQWYKYLLREYFIFHKMNEINNIDINNIYKIIYVP